MLFRSGETVWSEINATRDQMTFRAVPESQEVLIVIGAGLSKERISGILGIVLIAFSGKLPESVPVHFDSAGNANSFWPRNVVVFGVPAFCVLLNLIVDAVLSQHENKKTYMFYIMPVVAFAVTGIMIYLGMK